MKKATILIVALKSTKLIKLLKSAKVIKPALSVLSMAIFAVCHSLAMGVVFGVGLLVLLFIHELGHVIALKQKGYGVRLPFFIPFLGAVVMAPKMDCRHKESYIGYGGPLLGTVAAFLCGIPYVLTHHDIWLVLMFLGIILNLFNMIPVSPLDGGRITQAVHPWFKWFGLFLLLVFTVALGEPGMLIVWMAVIVDLEFLRFKKRLQGAICIWVLMFILTACGFGKNAWANWLDVFLGLILVVPCSGVLFVPNMQELEKELIKAEEERADRRPQLPLDVRWQWLALWLGLLFLQLAAVFVLTPYLPKR